MVKSGAKFRLRGLWRDIHLWIGAGLFVVLAPLGLTGTLIMYEDSLDKAVHGDRYHLSSPAQSPAAYVAAAQAAFAGRAVAAQLRMPQEPGGAVIVTGFAPVQPQPGQRPPGMTAWVDPGSAKVIAAADPRNELRGVVHRIHGNMLLPVNGRPFVGWLGVAMLVSCITGLCIWWPRRANLFLKALRWTRSPSVFSNVHHMVGFWLCAPLAVLSLTGAYIAFPQTMRAVFGPKPSATQGQGPVQGGPGRGFSAPVPTPALNADQALAAAQGADDGLSAAKLLSITLPTQGDKPSWRVQLKPASGAPVTVRVDDRSGKVRVTEGRGGDGPPARDPIVRVMRGIHEGNGYGPVWELIVAVTGLAPLLLGLTGIILWLTQRAKLSDTEA